MHTNRSRRLLCRDLVRWTLIIDPVGRPGRDNMSIDSALLRSVQEG